ncbi:VTC domain [Propionibacterium australiense]|uniref:CYTH-like domain n=2 Tax=Propionibacterium australiense TaxID=119981 RepID=A0A383S4B6_9ACTN|nr:VTC domain-containing protein [Propionibacterium australiense]RLP12182.1 VTC domain-containing protein [Propionibacterium australiense]SYZ32402.1 CYTH-like domain [Propionibacterium australiense]VEH90286.1 VTC domain [Propionibacterium australiense]
MTTRGNPLTGFTPIGLDELNDTAALQIRVDRKYLVPPGVLTRLLEELPPRTCVLTIAGRQSFTYDSTYFDTDALDSFHMTAYRRKRRWKIRERSYLDTGTSWLEVKTRRGEHTVKERIEVTGRQLNQWGDAEQRMIAEALGRAGVNTVPLIDLRPALDTRYRRMTFLDPSSRARLTLDQGLTWRDEFTRRTGQLGQTIVVETKSPGATPSDADRLLWQLGHRPARFSKYATGMAFLHDDLPHNTWHRAMGRLAQDLVLEEHLATRTVPTAHVPVTRIPARRPTPPHP